MAEERMRMSPSGHEYLPLLGLPAFRRGAAELIFGHGAELLSQQRVATIQTISGSGAIHIGAVFLKQHYTNSEARVYVSAPSWPNHRVMFEHVGFEVEDYPYFDPVTKNVDFDGIISTLERASPGDIVVLHACAHNPTGNDLTQEQWKTLGGILKDRNLFPVLDSAYQGFASGDLDADAWSIRYLLSDLSLSGMVCQSFSKSMGLYGERVGALHVTTSIRDRPDISLNIESQLSWISRKVISNAGRYGATIAATILSEPKLYEQWIRDLQTMAGRIYRMRCKVVEELERRGTPGNWRHIQTQIGMFSYTGISPHVVRRLRDNHIYMAENGRASICGLNEHNVERFCRVLDEILKEGVPDNDI
jgi:aspartate aminotransferase